MSGGWSAWQDRLRAILSPQDRRRPPDIPTRQAQDATGNEPQSTRTMRDGAPLNSRTSVAEEQAASETRSLARQELRLISALVLLIGFVIFLFEFVILVRLHARRNLAFDEFEDEEAEFAAD